MVCQLNESRNFFSNFMTSGWNQGEPQTINFSVYALAWLQFLKKCLDSQHSFG